MVGRFKIRYPYPVSRFRSKMFPIAAALLLIALSFPLVRCDFTYVDFNSTSGLSLNGAAEVTNCGEGEASASSSTILHQFGHTATLELSTSVETSNQTSSNDDIALHEGAFGHRDDFDAASDAGCSGRIRLTPSHPSKAGSVWYDTRVPVLTGFETTFSWTLSDHSKECTRHTDRAFAQYEHESCVVHGGDGFAFVIHGDPADASALGSDGEQLGYGGIMNSGKTTSFVFILDVLSTLVSQSGCMSASASACS